MNEETYVMCFSSTRCEYFFTHLNLKINNKLSVSEHIIYQGCRHGGGGGGGLWGLKPPPQILGLAL